MLNGQNRKIAANQEGLCAFFLGDFMNIVFFNEALKEAEKAEKKESVPVGAIIVRDNKIICKAHNINYRSKKIIDHAEIICINKAFKKNKDWRLNECDMYVTLEPCNMCKEVIKAARIRNVYYLSENNSSVCNSQTKFMKASIDAGELEKHNKEKLKNFFKKLR